MGGTRHEGSFEPKDLMFDLVKVRNGVIFGQV